MKACIHSGATHSGGTCVEIESHGRRVILDIGLPIDVKDPDVLACYSSAAAGRGDALLLGVVLLARSQFISPDNSRGCRAERLDDHKPVVVGPFTITPFLADYSPDDMYAVLVEADGRALLYTGDLRAGAIQKLLITAPRVDALLMEGATIGRATSSEGFPSETDFEEKFVSLFRQTPGMPLVWCATQNIDRIVTIYRACRRTNRQFIVDVETGTRLRRVDPSELPVAMIDRLRLFLPASRGRHARRPSETAIPSNPSPIHASELADAAPTSAMLFRPSMMHDVEDARCLKGARLIFSIWSGYLEYEKSNPFLEWLDRHGIPLDQCHTTGHAGIMELLKLREAFAKAPVVPIRARHRERFEELFGRVVRHAEGEWWEVGAPASS